MHTVPLSPGELAPSVNLVIAAICGFALLAAGIFADIFILTGLLSGRWRWRESIERLRARDWRQSDGLVLVLSLLAVYSLLAWYAAHSGYSPTSETGGLTTPFVVYTLLFHGVTGVGMLCLMRVRGLSWQRAFGHEGCRQGDLRRDALKGILLYAAAMPPVLLLAFLYGFALRRLDVPMEPQEVITLFLSPDSSLWLRAYLAILAIAVAPMVEEMCFRGIALPLLSRSGGGGAGVIAVSLLFAAIHFHVPSLAPLFGIAVAFALAYIYTGSLVTSIVMHAMFNGVSIAALFLLQDMLPYAG